MNESRKPITTWGEPGGIYLELHLNLDSGDYYLLNEGGDVLVSDPWESEVRKYAEAIVIAEQAAAGEVAPS